MRNKKRELMNLAKKPLICYMKLCFYFTEVKLCARNMVLMDSLWIEIAEAAGTVYLRASEARYSKCRGDGERGRLFKIKLQVFGDVCERMKNSLNLS